MADMATTCTVRQVINFGVTTRPTQRGPEIAAVRTAPVTPAMTTVFMANDIIFFLVLFVVILTTFPSTFFGRREKFYTLSLSMSRRYVVNDIFLLLSPASYEEGSESNHTYNLYV
jgi:hypothetical protein